MRNVKKRISKFCATMVAVVILFFGAPAHSALSHSTPVVKMTNGYSMGVGGSLLLGFKVDDGFKWNEKFPTKLSFAKKPNIIDIPYAVYEGGDFYHDGKLKVVLVPINFVPTKVGTEMLKVNLRYSVCDASSCVVETVRFDVGVTILP